MAARKIRTVAVGIAVVFAAISVSAQVDPPSPNDPTCMTVVNVPNATEMGAIYPTGDGAHFELNFTGSSGWVVHLSGGGWRFLPNTTRFVPATAPKDFEEGLTRDGVKKPLWPKRETLGADENQNQAACKGCYGICDGLMSDLPNINPAYHGYNKVFVPISGTSFTGNRDSLQPYPVRGARILQAVIEHLQASYGMAAATEVILTGTSSGGLATYLTCDRVGSMVGSVNSSTRFSCLADAGFFLDHPAMDGQNVIPPQFEESFYAWNSSGGTNQDCIAHYGPLGTPEKCLFAEYVLPFIKSPLFIAQNLDDSWQLNNILQIGCGGYNKPMTDCNQTQFEAVHAYAAAMRTRLGAMPENTGAFAPTCIAHGQTVENEHPAALWAWPERWGINNGSTVLVPRDIYMAWKDGSSTIPTKIVEQCDWNQTTCNPLCPLFT